MRKIFFRCIRGHYFQDTCCPWDGWSHQAFDKVLDEAERIEARGDLLSIDKLKEAGIPDEIFKRILVVEFGCAESAFDAINPKELIVGNDVLDISTVSSEFL